DDTLYASLPHATNIQVETSPLEFGRDVPGMTEIFNGKIDDIAIWNRALSPDEITAVYSGYPLGTGKTENENQLFIFPNPAGNKINVMSSAHFPGAEYRITNQIGRTVLSGELHSVNDIISLNGLPQGLYFLNIYGDV